MTTTTSEPTAPWRWQTRAFDALRVAELHAILQLRAEVFVLEQRCVYLDVDGKDPRCHHLTAWHGEELVAYARLLPPTVSYAEVSIGRVVTSSRHRAMGVGQDLVARSLDECRRLFGDVPIRIGAQNHLRRFYERFGFVVCSAPYDEDGISHVDMLRRLSA